jgi:MFS family permease
MRAAASTGRPAQPSYGWVLVAVLAVTETTSYGVLTYAFAVFLLPMHAELGWSRAQLSGAYTLALLVSGLAAVPVGRWLDRHGPRALMTIGSTLATLLVLAWAHTHQLAGFYIIWAGIGLTMAAVLYEPAFATITTWFTAGRDQALLALTVVAGFASTIYVPLAQWLVDTRGWRNALIILAALLGTLTIVPHALLLCHRPHRLDPEPADGAAAATIPGAAATPVMPAGVRARTALRQAAFWWLAAAFMLAYLGSGALSVHLVAALREQGHSPGTAAAATGLLGASAVAGRILMAPASRRWSRPNITATIFALQAVGILALLGLHHPLGIVMFFVLFGAGRGIISLARATLVADFYGRREYASINGVLALLLTAATALGPLGAGVLRTHLRSYTPILCLVAITAALAAAAMLTAQHSQQRHQAAALNGKPDSQQPPPDAPRRQR